MTTPAEMMMDSVDWERVTDGTPVFNDGLPYVTHKGYLQIGDISLRCYQLDDGRRIIDAEDVARFFGVVPDELTGAPRSGASS